MCQPPSTDPVDRSRTTSLAMLGLALVLLLASACGQAADPLEPSDSPDVIHRGFEALNHGPRYFEAPEEQFFDDPGLIVVNPDATEREPLILSAESYWLADEDVAASTVDATTVRFPRDGYEHMRGYRAGHIVLSRTALLRRYISRVELTEREIIWHTREAELEEAVIHGEFHMDVLPGSTIPEDFDIVDTYLYPSVETQRHDLYSRRLAMYDINRRVLKQESEENEERETCELETCDIPCAQWEDGAEQEPEFDPDTGEVIEDGPVDPASACMDWVRDNRSVYADDLSGPLLCTEGLSDEQCADIICSDICEIDDGFEEPFDPGNEPESGPSGGVGIGFTFCLNPFNEEESAQLGDDFQQLCDLSVSGIDLTFNGETGGDFGGGNGSYSASFEFKLTPRVQVALGFKAGMKIKIWKPKVRAYAGIYTGFGFGATMTLSAELAVQYNWSKHYEFLIFSFNIFFVNLSAYVYAGLDVNFRLSIEGTISYDYWRSSVNYLCMNICVGGCPFIKLYRSRWGTNKETDAGEWKTDDGALGQTKCGLPGPNSLGVPGNFDGFRDVRFEAEASASVGLNVGVGARIGVGAPGAAIPLAGPGEYNLYFQPLELSLQAGIRIAPPLCNYHYGLYLGGAAGIGIGLPLVGHVKKEWRLYGPIKLFGDDGTLSGFLGCGEFEPSEPYIVERNGCSNDQQCMDLAEPGTMSRCFQRQCVDHDNVRVSLGWVTNQDLDLYINKPSEGDVYNRSTQPDLFSRQDCGGTCTSEELGPFIENFTFPYDDEGEWLAWVVLNEAADNDATETDIVYTLEVEFGNGEMRQTIEGRIDSQTSNQSVVRFAICSPNATSPRCQTQAGIVADDGLPSDDDAISGSPNEF